MAQIIQPNRSFGEALGSGFGAGLTELLQGLAAQKAQEIQSRKVTQALVNSGVNPNLAALYNVLPAEERKNFIQNLEFGAPRQQLPQETAQESFNDLLQQQLQPQQMRYELPQTSVSQLEQMLKPQNIAQAAPLLRLNEMLGQMPGQLPQSQEMKEIVARGLQPQTRQKAPLQPQEIVAEKQIKLSPKREQDLRQKSTQFGAPQEVITESVRYFEDPQAKLRRQQLALKQEQLSQKERVEAFKLTQAERKEILQKSKAARENLKELDRLEELQQEGKLDTPGYVEFLERSGLDIPALMNEGSQEFNKITQNFLRDAKSYFGARVSNFEIEQFLKTIPNLSQSPEGRQRVIANLKKLQRGAVEYANTMRDVIRENNNVPPLDLIEQIEERIEPRMDKIAKQFKKDLSKPVPPAQNRLVTALQASLGSVIGRVPSAAKGAVKGAIGGAAIGRLGGLPGTAAGATIGGIGGALGGLTGLL